MFLKYIICIATGYLFPLHPYHRLDPDVFRVGCHKQPSSLRPSLASQLTPDTDILAKISSSALVIMMVAGP